MMTTHRLARIAMVAAIGTAAMLVLVAAAELPGVSTGAAATSKVCTAQNAADATLEAGGASGDEACALQHALRRTTRIVASVSDGDSGAKAGTSARRHAAPIQRSWSKRRPAEAELEHELIFLVETRSMDELQQMLIDRSSPNSPRFRQWLSREEALGVERKRASLEATRRVLEEAGATSLVEVGSTFIKARAPVATWQKLLDTELFVYGRSHDDGEEVGGGHERVRAESYALPASLASHVVGVLKLLQLDEPQKSRAGPDSKVFPKSSPEPLSSRHAAAGHAAAPDQSDVSSPHVSHPSFSASPSAPSPPSPPSTSSPAAGASACHSLPCPTYDSLYELVGGEFITPEVLREGYKIPPVAAAGSPEAKLRANVTHLVYASINQNWSPADRDLFQRQFGLPEIAVDELDEAGAHNNSEVCKKSPKSCAEANLDVQYMNAMSPWSNLTFYYTQSKSRGTDFDDFIVDLLALDPMPHVVSISYGLLEAAVALDTMKAFDMAVVQYNLMGGSVFVASGDDGAAGYRPNPNCSITKIYGLQVGWPASSPFVTAVGATMGLGMGLPEVVCATQGTSETFRAARYKPTITSSGGYSNFMAVPEWQRGHLAFGVAGRGVPDVAFAGHYFVIAMNGGWMPVDGTSASSPSFAGMISLINAKRKADGKGTLGFLNPSLYAAPWGTFNDIIEGDNVCGSSGEPCCGGYFAGPGWDAATGLGTPNFERLFEYLTA